MSARTWIRSRSIWCSSRLWAKFIIARRLARVSRGWGCSRSESKGNELTREVNERLKNAHMQYIGNVEGGDLFSGSVDVIVCDGFVGNIALKICEGLAMGIFSLLKKSMNSAPWSQLGAILSQGAFKGLKKTIDYTEYGGAPLLGVRGVCVIGHGRSNANAIKNAIRVAAGLAKANVNEKIEQELSLVSERV